MNQELLFILNQLNKRMRVKWHSRRLLCYSAWKMNDKCIDIDCINCMLNGKVEYPPKITLEKLSNEPRDLIDIKRA